MTGLRRHLISLAAGCFALAIGIALGAGPLQGPVADGLQNQADRDRAVAEQLRTETVDARAELEFADGYAAGTAGTLVASQLAGRTVSLALLPGSDRRDVRALGELVAAADGTVVSTVAWTADMLDPANRQLADGLARRLLDRTDRDDRAVDSYPMLGAAYARAFLTADERQQLQDSDAEGIEAALAEAGFIKLSEPADRRAQLALVVAGDPVATAADGQADVTAELSAALDAGSLGVVVAGTPASADGGAVGAVRGSRARTEVSTVDAVDLPGGRVSAVLAVAEQSRGGVGQYGVVGADDGAVP